MASALEAANKARAKAANTQTGDTTNETQTNDQQANTDTSADTGIEADGGSSYIKSQTELEIEAGRQAVARRQAALDAVKKAEPETEGEGDEGDGEKPKTVTTITDE